MGLVSDATTNTTTNKDTVKEVYRNQLKTEKQKLKYIENKQFKPFPSFFETSDDENLSHLILQSEPITINGINAKYPCQKLRFAAGIIDKLEKTKKIKCFKHKGRYVNGMGAFDQDNRASKNY